jgi:hypothetical protein
MNKKLRIGDIIRFISDHGTSPAYTILDIDTSRPGMFDGRIYNSHFYIQWGSGDRTYTTWTGDFEIMNQKLNLGGIIILNPSIEPIKSVKKFTL